LGIKRNGKEVTIEMHETKSATGAQTRSAETAIETVTDIENTILGTRIATETDIGIETETGMGSAIATGIVTKEKNANAIETEAETERDGTEVETETGIETETEESAIVNGNTTTTTTGTKTRNSGLTHSRDGVLGSTGWISSGVGTSLRCTSFLYMLNCVLCAPG